MARDRCAASRSQATVSTIGIQRALNYALAPMSRERFIHTVTSDLPDAPPYFTYDAMLNARERPTLEQVLERELQPLTLEPTLDLADAGAQLLDTRDPLEFDGAHISGAINVGLGGSHATWCGTILDRDRPIVLIAVPATKSRPRPGSAGSGLTTSPATSPEACGSSTTRHSCSNPRPE
jgi:hydroxyacylglutathione hydrolase